jgi:hypothetical protein
VMFQSGAVGEPGGSPRAPASNTSDAGARSARHQAGQGPLATRDGPSECRSFPEVGFAAGALNVLFPARTQWVLPTPITDVWNVCFSARPVTVAIPGRS